MNMDAALTARIEGLKSIVEHLPDTALKRREHYQEKCDIYRRIRADLAGERRPPREQTQQ